jgi:hypothetical protein
MIDDVLTRIANTTGHAVKKSGTGYIARCPAHDDHNPSLSITENAAGGVLLHCHAGCTTDAIVHAVGIELRDLMPPRPDTERRIVETYDYHDATGALVYQVVRFEPKDFRQRRPDGTGGWVWNLRGIDRVLYHLPDVIAAIDAGDPVWIAEGEKDADTLRAEGVVATTNPQGAGKWSPAYTSQLAGADVVIVADTDPPGRAHARTIADALNTAAGTTTAVIVEPAHGKDITDHIRHRLTLADLRPLTADDVAKQEPNGDRPTIAPTGITWIDIPTLLAAAPPAHAWVWDGYIERRTLTVLHGDGGTGKSILAGHLARAIIAGGRCLSRDTATANVLIVDAENPLDEIHRRLHLLDMATVPTDRIAYARASEAILRPGPDYIDVDALIAMIEHHHTGVAILDSQRGLWAGDEREAVEIRVLYRRLQSIAEQHDCAVIVIHHDRRTGSFSGSSDVHNAADTRLHLTRPDPEKAERVLTHAKARSSAELPAVEYTFGVDHAAGVYLFSQTREPVTDLTRVRDALTDQWQISTDLAGAAGIRREDIVPLLWALTRDGTAEYEVGPEGRRKTAKCWRRRSHTPYLSEPRDRMGQVAMDVPTANLSGGVPPLSGESPRDGLARGYLSDPPDRSTPTPPGEEPF